MQATAIVIPVLNFRDFIASSGDELTTTSNQVAAVFGKRHDHVLVKIRELIAGTPARFNHPHFRAVVYLDSKGESRASYVLTRTGFSLLAMRFTGAKALLFQVAYVDAFEAMGAFVKNVNEGWSYKRMQQDSKERISEDIGSYHGKGLNKRKHEITVLAASRAVLEDEGQIKLIS